MRRNIGAPRWPRSWGARRVYGTVFSWPRARARPAESCRVVLSHYISDNEIDLWPLRLSNSLSDYLFVDIGSMGLSWSSFLGDSLFFLISPSAAQVLWTVHQCIYNVVLLKIKPFLVYYDTIQKGAYALICLLSPRPKLINWVFSLWGPLSSYARCVPAVLY